jgi:hypothetical protein
MAKKTASKPVKKAVKKPVKKGAKLPTTKNAKKPAEKQTQSKPEELKVAQVHLLGLEMLAEMILKPAVPAVPAAAADVVRARAPAAAAAPMSAADAVIWALSQAVGPVFGALDSVSGLQINTPVKWSGLANRIRSKRPSYGLNGAQTKAKLPSAPGDTVSALIGVVSSNS